MIWFPFLGALALASSILFEKISLKDKKVDIKLFQTATFLSVVILMLPLIYFFWEVKPEAIEITNLFIFLIVIILSIFANLFTFYSMKWEKITKLEPAKMLEPLFVILLAILFSFFFDSDLYERNIGVIIPAIIAAGALIFSHIKKHHLKFNKYFIAAIIGSFFFAMELVVSRIILEFYSPISFYFLRGVSIFVISLFTFSPNLKTLNKKSALFIILTAMSWVLYRVIVYYGYIKLGVIFTTLLVMLGPVFVYIFAWKFLQEKLNWRNITSAIIILLCVLYVVLF